MKNFNTWLKEAHGEMEMPAWDDKRPLNVKIQIIRRNSAYDEISDDQLERLLDYLVAEDIAQMKPQKAFDDANDLSIAVSAGLAGGGDVDWTAIDYDDKDD